MVPDKYTIQRLDRVSRERALTLRESVLLERAIERERRHPIWPEHPGKNCDCPTCERIWGGS